MFHSSQGVASASIKTLVEQEIAPNAPQAPQPLGGTVADDLFWGWGTPVQFQNPSGLCRWMLICSIVVTVDV